MTKAEEATARRELGQDASRNPLGPHEYRIIERRALVRPTGPNESPMMIVVSDKRCVF